MKSRPSSQVMTTDSKIGRACGFSTVAAAGDRASHRVDKIVVHLFELASRPCCELVACLRLGISKKYFRQRWLAPVTAVGSGNANEAGKAGRA
jgi:hypothetical protein